MPAGVTTTPDKWNKRSQIAKLSVSTFCPVLPTLPMFLVPPALLKAGLGVIVSLGKPL